MDNIINVNHVFVSNTKPKVITHQLIVTLPDRELLGLNLEKGEGLHSLQMITTRANSTPGVRSFTIGQHNNNGGYQTYVGGSSNIIPLTDAFQTGNDLLVGENNILLGSNTVMAGSGNKSFGNNSLVVGTGNFDFFDETAYSNGAYKKLTSNSILTGENVRNNGANSILVGKNLINTGKISALFGFNQNNSGVYAFQAGDGHNNTGTYSFQYGYANNNSAQHCTQFGSSNKNTYRNVHELGIGLESTASDQIIVGYSFKPSASALFSAGYSRPRFEVYKDGRAMVETPPKNDNDVVRLKELKDAIKNISTGSGLALPDNITIDETGFKINKPGSSAVNPHAYVKLDSIEIAEGNYDKLTILKDRINCITKSQYTVEVANSSLRFPDGDVWPGKRDYRLPTHHTGSITLASESWVIDYINRNIAVRKMQIVDVLPTAGISTSTLYLLKLAGSSNTNVYAEFIYINNAWEQVGTTGSVSIDTEPIYKRIENVETQVTTLDGTVLTLDGRVTDIKADVDGITTNITGIDSKLEGEIATRETAISQINQRADAIDSTVSQTTERINTITGEIEVLNTEVSGVKQTATEISQSLTNNYYTAKQVDDIVAGITPGEPNLSGYVKTTDFQNTLKNYSPTIEFAPSLEELRKLTGQAAAFKMTKSDEQQTDEHGDLLYYTGSGLLTTESETNGVPNNPLMKYIMTGFADKIQFAANEFEITSGNLIVTSDPDNPENNMVAVNGEINATSGNIGGLIITPGTADTGDAIVTLSTADGNFSLSSTTQSSTPTSSLLIANLTTDILTTDAFDASEGTIDTLHTTLSKADLVDTRSLVANRINLRRPNAPSSLKCFELTSSSEPTGSTRVLISVEYSTGPGPIGPLGFATKVAWLTLYVTDEDGRLAYDLKHDLTVEVRANDWLGRTKRKRVTIPANSNEYTVYWDVSYKHDVQCRVRLSDDDAWSSGVYFDEIDYSNVTESPVLRVYQPLVGEGQSQLGTTSVPFYYGNVQHLRIHQLLPSLRQESIFNEFTDTDDIGSAAYAWTNIYGTNIYGTVQNGSDERLKHDINTVPDEYSEFFDKLRPVSYRLNDDVDHKLRFGLIADEVHDALTDLGFTPSAFTMNGSFVKDKVEYKTLAYSEFIALCINEIQKLKKRVTELENK